MAELPHSFLQPYHFHRAPEKGSGTRRGVNFNAFWICHVTSLLTPCEQLRHIFVESRSGESSRKSFALERFAQNM